jgi:hypothetical protein
MAAVHPGALATGALQKEEEEEEVSTVTICVIRLTSVTIAIHPSVSTIPSQGM